MKMHVWMCSDWHSSIVLMLLPPDNKDMGSNSVILLFSLQKQCL